jgi:hypothetical protein
MISLKYIRYYLSQFIKSTDKNHESNTEKRFTYSPKPFIGTLTINTRNVSLFGVNIDTISKITIEDFLAKSKLADYPMRVDRENDYFLPKISEIDIARLDFFHPMEPL